MNPPQTFKYSLGYKMIFRYGNIPISFVFVLYLLPVITSFNYQWTQSVYLLVFVALIIVLNRHYIKLYKLMPYKIEMDDEKLFFTDFTINDRTVTMKFEDIVSLKGGIFDGKISGLMKITDTSGNEIGFFHKLTNAKQLETMILSKVKKEIYDAVIEKLSARRGKIRDKASGSK